MEDEFFAVMDVGAWGEAAVGGDFFAVDGV